MTGNSKFWSILFFAFRFNFNMSHDPDSMQSPEQVSDFDGDAWFCRSRRLKFVSVYFVWATIYFGILKFKFSLDCARAGIFFSEFLYGGDLSFYE